MISQGMWRSLSIQCNERDRHLLLNFKHTVVDPSAILSTWSDERDCCEWDGVQCDNTTGRVMELSLPCSQQDPFVADCGEKKPRCLTGEIHLSSLLQLEFLDYLDLSFNDFHAIVQNDYVDDITDCNNLSVADRPHFCGNSSIMHYLDLSYNGHLDIGSLDWLYRFPSLEYVNFTGINLQGRVDWIQLPTLLPSLKELSLENCQLTSINPSLQFVNLTSLEVLNLSNNDLSSEFPVWLFNLSDVTTIDLSFNFLQGQFPKRLLNLQKIKELNLNQNKFNGPIPDWLGQLEHLQVLDVSDNFFSGPIPSTLGNMSSLIVLDVSSNHLNGSLPESLGQLLNLKVFGFNDNHLMGYVSERNFVKLSNLTKLYMGSPNLISNFDSPWWVPPFQLEVIHLDHMVGSKFPAWIYTQTYLERLIITHSVISFEPPDKFWDFVAQLPYIHLQDNTIHGEMPNVLLNSTIVRLSSNNIKGNLPRLSPNVVMFTAAQNSFQGPISPLLCHKVNGRTQLQYLDLSDNLLSGGLTNCWIYWKSLVLVNLDGNDLTGTIPPSISLLSNLSSLHLNKNNLFGGIPSSLVNCPKLQILDVGENKLSGFLTNWMPKKVKILRLRSNQLSGSIPPQICQLASLRILDFADNNISGSLPICLKNLTGMTFCNSSNNRAYRVCTKTLRLTYVSRDRVMVHIKGQGLIYDENLMFLHAIDLSSNNISGSIPPEIFSLAGLQSLNLSHNQLEGNIPNEISNLNNWESLDLSSNQLSGEIPQGMAKLSFLGTLNLSFNNFTGKIPSGTQLQGFDAQSYIGNCRDIVGDIIRYHPCTVHTLPEVRSPAIYSAQAPVRGGRRVPIGQPPESRRRLSSAWPSRAVTPSVHCSRAVAFCSVFRRRLSFSGVLSRFPAPSVVPRPIPATSTSWVPLIEKEDHLTDNPPDEKDASRKSWLRDDARLLLQLRNSIDSEIMPSITHCEFVKELMDYLALLYSGKNNISRIYEVCRSFYRSEMPVDRSLTNFFMDFKSTYEELNVLMPISDDRKVNVSHREQMATMSFLTALPSQYAAARSQILLGADIPSLEEAFSRVLRTEQNPPQLPFHLLVHYSVEARMTIEGSLVEVVRNQEGVIRSPRK
ncbi:receptor-like protein EIX1 [Neltuma alba]|uniref:receptor-like protein EIX1 n=1 Tax=Neltuma alba TaxID=207710 RepID=UPI0010A39388|nr:receptor-like protein EIX1 [Prosopis alba]